MKRPTLKEVLMYRVSVLKDLEEAYRADLKQYQVDLSSLSLREHVKNIKLKHIKMNSLEKLKIENNPMHH